MLITLQTVGIQNNTKQSKTDKSSQKVIYQRNKQEIDINQKKKAENNKWRFFRVNIICVLKLE